MRELERQLWVGRMKAPSAPGAQWSHVAGRGTCLWPGISSGAEQSGVWGRVGLGPQNLSGDSEKAFPPTSPLLCAEPRLGLP